MPRVDLTEILLEIAARTGCMDAFAHLTERSARSVDLTTSLCAVLLAEACNTGPEPFVRQETPALRRDRLQWVDRWIVPWNTLYMDAMLAQLRSEGYPARPEDEVRLSPFGHEHINMLGRYSFAVPDAVT